MDLKLLFTLILGSIFILFITLSILFLRRERLIKNNSTASVLGTVVSYSHYNEARTPVVEYIVDGEKFKKAFRYSYIITGSRPLNSVKSSAKDDLFDTKIRLKENSILSINTIMQDNFPLGSKMKVYYNPQQPKIGYVERYAPLYLWIVFLVLAIIMLLLNILLFFIS